MKRSAFSILIVALSAWSQPAGAQTDATAPLEALAGDWSVTYEMAPGPSGHGGSGEGTLTSRLGPGGHSVILDYASTTGPAAGFKIHQVIAWNADENRYDIAWVDSYNPGVTQARGRLEGGGIAYSRESTNGEHKVTSKGRISEIGPASFVITSFVSLDGGPDVEIMTLRYTRKK